MKLHTKIFLQFILLSMFTCALSHAGGNHGNKPDYKKIERGYLKPGAPVRLLEPHAINMDPASQKNIEVQFEAPKEGQLIIETKAENGLNVDIDKVTRIDLSQSTATLHFNITSSTAGKHYLMFTATYEKDGQRAQRSMGISVQVGNTPEPAQQKAQPPYVIMDAEETVH
ncbi:MAG: hypothetical protein K6L76_11510 [Agarilytica sp.]